VCTSRTGKRLPCLCRKSTLEGIEIGARCDVGGLALGRTHHLDEIVSMWNPVESVCGGNGLERKILGFTHDKQILSFSLFHSWTERNEFAGR